MKGAFKSVGKSNWETIHIRDLHQFNTLRTINDGGVPVKKRLGTAVFMLSGSYYTSVRPPFANQFLECKPQRQLTGRGESKSVLLFDF